jgi:hypothetical protein
VDGNGLGRELECPGRTRALQSRKCAARLCGAELWVDHRDTSKAAATGSLWATYSLEAALYQPRGLTRFLVVVLDSGSGEVPRRKFLQRRVRAAKGIGTRTFVKRRLGDSGGVATGSDSSPPASDVVVAVRLAKSLSSTTDVGI